MKMYIYGNYLDLFINEIENFFGEKMRIKIKCIFGEKLRIKIKYIFGEKTRIKIK